MICEDLLLRNSRIPSISFFLNRRRIIFFNAKMLIDRRKAVLNTMRRFQSKTFEHNVNFSPKQKIVTNYISYQVLV